MKEIYYKLIKLKIIINFYNIFTLKNGEFALYLIIGRHSGLDSAVLKQERA